MLRIKIQLTMTFSNWIMLNNALRHWLSHQKKSVFIKKWCNYYLIKSNRLYFQDKISFLDSLISVLEASVNKTVNNLVLICYRL